MNWLQFGYEYIVGGIFFFVTLYLCFHSGGVEIKNVSDRKALIYLLGGFVGFFLFNLCWILLAS